MATAKYCGTADVKNELGLAAADTGEDTLIDSYIDRACDAIDRELRLTFGQETLSAQVFRSTRGEVRADPDGSLSVRVGIPHITAISALAYRLGDPTGDWTPVDPTAIDLATGDCIWWLTAYPQGWDGRPARAHVAFDGGVPLWARVSGTAGYAAGTFPADLVQLATSWTVWLYRGKDAPFEQTANAATGTVTIPGKLPPKLCKQLERWREWVV